MFPLLPFLPRLRGAWLETLLDASLAEDVGAGDATTAVAVAPGLHAEGWIVARRDGVVAGLPLLPRLYRQAPLNSIWEGSGNIQCLDVLRALAREPEALAALRAELAAVADRDARYAAALQRWAAAPPPDESQARLFCERTVLLLQAALLLRAQSPMAEAFVRSRLQAEHGLVFGTLPTGVDLSAMLVRALP